MQGAVWFGGENDQKLGMFMLAPVIWPTYVCSINAESLSQALTELLFTTTTEEMVLVPLSQDDQA